MPIISPKHILIAPLDWGLGHTARCIPIIKYLRENGHHPIVAGNEQQLSFLRESGAGAAQIILDGYDITYSKWNRFAQAGLLAQLPRIQKTIAREHEWLLRLCKTQQIDGIISDNRYGLFHPTIPSVIMTHQLQVLSGMGGGLDRAVQRIHYNYLERFRDTWVVDVEGDDNLGGKLSHTKLLPRSTRYIGLLSRFAGQVEKAADAAIVLLISGPEPQRTELSAMLWQQCERYNGNTVFVEGSEAATAPVHIPGHITYHKRLAGSRLNDVLYSASVVICRSGYSSIMDMVALRKKAILIPTRGQTEQEYLGRYLCERNMFYSTSQKGFDLSRAIKAGQDFNHNLPVYEESYKIYQPILQAWVESL